jgi:hypothetical protein
MTDKPSGLKKLWNILSGKHPLENPDGTVTTRHGRHIIPYRQTLDRNGALGSNLPAVLAQPRMHELMAQMQPLADSRAANDKLMLDETTGDFFLKSDVQRHGAAKAKPLGQIDIATEKDLFIFAAEEITLRRHFGPPPARRGDLRDSMTGQPVPRSLPPLPPPTGPRRPPRRK